MKKSFVGVAAVVVLVGLLAGCSPVAYMGPMGGLYANMSVPVTATESEKGSKTGIATAQTILGMVATGDCSITAAARNGNIIKIKTVDFDILNYVGVYAKVTTRVTGE